MNTLEERTKAMEKRQADLQRINDDLVAVRTKALNEAKEIIEKATADAKNMAARTEYESAAFDKRMRESDKAAREHIEKLTARAGELGGQIAEAMKRSEELKAQIAQQEATLVLTEKRDTLERQIKELKTGHDALVERAEAIKLQGKEAADQRRAAIDAYVVEEQAKLKTAKEVHAKKLADNETIAADRLARLEKKSIELQASIDELESMNSKLIAQITATRGEMLQVAIR